MSVYVRYINVILHYDNMKGADVKLAFLEKLMKITDAHGYFSINKNTIEDLQLSIKRSERQVYRLLKFFEKKGIIFKIMRGQYWLNKELANEFIYAHKNKEKIVVATLFKELIKHDLEIDQQILDEIKEIKEMLKEVKKVSGKTP